MGGAAALITAIAALVAALAWPVTIAVLLLLYRTHLRVAAENLPAIVRRMRKVKMGAFEAELSDRADDLVDEAMADPGAISARQLRSAARIKVAAEALPEQTLRQQARQLSVEYESIRKAMFPGPERTRAMLNVLVRMRTLAPAMTHLLDELKASNSPGDRLAAIAIMQVDPSLVDLDWLLARFSADRPFIFFQAATVLRIRLNLDAGQNDEVVRVAREALETIHRVNRPDADTVAILEALAAGKPG